MKIKKSTKTFIKQILVDLISGTILLLISKYLLK